MRRLGALVAVLSGLSATSAASALQLAATGPVGATLVRPAGGGIEPALRPACRDRFCRPNLYDLPALRPVASPPFCDRNPNHQLCADADDDRFCERRLDHPLCDRARFCNRRPDHPLCDDAPPPSPS